MLNDSQTHTTIIVLIRQAHNLRFTILVVHDAFLSFLRPSISMLSVCFTLFKPIHGYLPCLYYNYACSIIFRVPVICKGIVVVILETLKDA